MKQKNAPTCFDCIFACVTAEYWGTYEDQGYPAEVECPYATEEMYLQSEEGRVKACNHFMYFPVGVCPECKKLCPDPAYSSLIVVTLYEGLAVCSPKCQELLQVVVDKEIKEMVEDSR